MVGGNGVDGGNAGMGLGAQGSNMGGFSSAMGNFADSQGMAFGSDPDGPGVRTVTPSTYNPYAGMSDEERKRAQWAKNNANSTLTYDQYKVQEQMGGILNEILSGIADEGDYYTPYPGEYVSGAGTLQESTFGLIDQMLSGGGGMGEAQSALSNILSEYDPAAAKDYWQKSVYDPAKSRLDTTMRGVMEPFVAMEGLDSGAARRAMAQTAGQFETDMTGQLSNILFQGQQSDIANKLRASGQMGGLQQILSNIGLSGGAQQRDIANELLQGDYQSWLGEQSYSNPWLNQVMPYLGADMTYQNRPYPEQADTSGADMMSTVGTVAAMAMMFSSRKLKKDIRYL